MTPLVPACCAHLARWLVPNGSFFLAAVYSLYYLALEPLAGGSWAGEHMPYVVHIYIYMYGVYV